VCQRDGESAYFRFFAFGAAFFTTFFVAAIVFTITPSPPQDKIRPGNMQSCPVVDGFPHIRQMGITPSYYLVFLSAGLLVLLANS
jgi:hypothetical protein